MKSRGMLAFQRVKYRDAERVVLAGSGFRVRKLTAKEIEEMRAHIDMLRSHGPRKAVRL